MKRCPFCDGTEFMPVEGEPDGICVACDEYDGPDDIDYMAVSAEERYQEAGRLKARLKGGY